jgi:hypothetical protein
VRDADGATVQSKPERKNGAGLHGELRRHLSRMGEEDKLLLVSIAENIAGRCLAGHNGRTRKRRPGGPGRR